MKLENGRFLRITELYAFVSVDKSGEGIMGIQMPNGDWMPLIGADVERVESIKPFADKIAAQMNVPYEIRYFKAV